MKYQSARIPREEWTPGQSCEDDEHILATLAAVVACLLVCGVVVCGVIVWALWGGRG
jgi:uncharacterized Tic20 family protein